MRKLVADGVATMKIKNRQHFNSINNILSIIIKIILPFTKMFQNNNNLLLYIYKEIYVNILS